MVEVIWLPRSLFNLRDIGNYIAQFDPAAADKMSRRLREAGEGLTDFPNRGRLIGKTVRALSTVPPYVVFYKVESDVVYILAVRHGRRRLPKSLMR